MRTATRRIMGTAVLMLAIATAGCSPNNRIVASNIVESNDWYGELGITGHLNQITVNAPSDITKLSIVGDANVVHVQPRVTLGKVEIFGERNQVFIPARLIIRSNIVGNGSEIIRLRPGEAPRVRRERGDGGSPMNDEPGDTGEQPSSYDSADTSSIESAD
jgi:hypothetical protein